VLLNDVYNCVKKSKLQRVSVVHRSSTGVCHSDMHWLDIPQRVQYKLGLTVHQCPQHRSPKYLMDHCTLKTLSDVAGRQHLCSVSCQQYSCHVTVSARLVVGHSLLPVRRSWNTLPSWQRCRVGRTLVLAGKLSLS